MQVNKNIIEELLNDAGYLITERAKKITNEQKIRVTKIIYDDENNFELHGKAYGNDIYDTYIDVTNGEIETIKCTCQYYYKSYGVCKHSLATLLKFDNMHTEEILHNKKMESNILGKRKQDKYNSFNQLVKTLYNEELNEIDSNIDSELKNEGNIRIEPKIIYDKCTNLKI